MLNLFCVQANLLTVSAVVMRACFVMAVSYEHNNSDELSFTETTSLPDLCRFQLFWNYI